MTSIRALRTRTGFIRVGLLTLLTAGLAAGVWAAWSSRVYDRDLKRRWALPGAAKALAEEEISLTPRSVGDLAEDEVKAALARYAATVAAAPACAEDAARQFREESDAAQERAELLHRELERRTAGRRLELRREALALVAEWDALFARHPEWPPHRLTAEE